MSSSHLLPITHQDDLTSRPQSVGHFHSWTSLMVILHLSIIYRTRCSFSFDGLTTACYCIVLGRMINDRLGNFDMELGLGENRYEFISSGLMGVEAVSRSFHVHVIYVQWDGVRKKLRLDEKILWLLYSKFVIDWLLNRSSLLSVDAQTWRVF